MVRHRGRLILGIGTTLVLQFTGSTVSAGDKRIVRPRPGSPPCVVPQAPQVFTGPTCPPQTGPVDPGYSPPPQTTGPDAPAPAPGTTTPPANNDTTPPVGPQQGDQFNQNAINNAFNNQNQTQNFNNSLAQSQARTGSSGQSIAPNLIGDLFTTGARNEPYVVIQPPSYSSQGPAVNVTTFQSGYNLRNFTPTGGNFGEFTPGGGGPDNLFFNITGAAGQTFNPPVQFTSNSTTGPAGFGGPIQLNNVNADPGQPAPGTFLVLDQDGAPYQNAVRAQILAQQPGIAQQEANFTAANGQGTFAYVGDNVVFVGGYATQRDQFGYYVQQIERYDPGVVTFTPDPVTVDPAAYRIYFPVDPATAPGANVGRVKLTENTSPIPRDRVYFNYSYFSDTTLSGIDVNRVTPGFEKTFFDGLASIEVRTPFASTLDSNIVSGGLTNTGSTEFGNMSAYFKMLFLQSDTLAVSGGVGVALPTADDVTVRDGLTGNSLLTVKNEAVHVLPFIGVLYTPTERLFLQSLVQFDFDANGNPVYLSNFANGLPTAALSKVGNANDMSYAFVGASAGYWVYLNQNPRATGLTGIAPIAELHYNAAMSTGDRVAGNLNGTPYDFGRPDGIDLLNGVVGVQALLNRNATMTMAYAAPLGGDDQFDGEFRVMFNWFFGGGLNKFSRIQF